MGWNQDPDDDELQIWEEDDVLSDLDFPDRSQELERNKRRSERSASRSTPKKAALAESSPVVGKKRPAITSPPFEPKPKTSPQVKRRALISTQSDHSTHGRPTSSSDQEMCPVVSLSSSSEEERDRPSRAASQPVVKKTKRSHDKSKSPEQTTPTQSKGKERASLESRRGPSPTSALAGKSFAQLIASKSVAPAPVEARRPSSPPLSSTPAPPERSASHAAQDDEEEINELESDDDTVEGPVGSAEQCRPAEESQTLPRVRSPSPSTPPETRASRSPAAVVPLPDNRLKVVPTIASTVRSYFADPGPREAPVPIQIEILLAQLASPAHGVPPVLGSQAQTAEQEDLPAHFETDEIPASVEAIPLGSDEMMEVDASEQPPPPAPAPLRQTLRNPRPLPKGDVDLKCFVVPERVFFILHFKGYDEELAKQSPARPQPRSRSHSLDRFAPLRQARAIKAHKLSLAASAGISSPASSVMIAEGEPLSSEVESSDDEAPESDLRWVSMPGGDRVRISNEKIRAGTSRWEFVNLRDSLTVHQMRDNPDGLDTSERTPQERKRLRSAIRDQKRWLRHESKQRTQVSRREDPTQAQIGHLTTTRCISKDLHEVLPVSWPIAPESWRPDPAKQAKLPKIPRGIGATALQDTIALIAWRDSRLKIVAKRQREEMREREREEDEMEREEDEKKREKERERERKLVESNGRVTRGKVGEARGR